MHHVAYLKTFQRFLISWEIMQVRKHLPEALLTSSTVCFTSLFSQWYSPVMLTLKISKPAVSHMYVYRFSFLWSFDFLHLEYTPTPVAHLANSYSSFRIFLRHHLFRDISLPNSVISVCFCHIYTLYWCLFLIVLFPNLIFILLCSLLNHTSVVGRNSLLHTSKHKVWFGVH